MMTQSVPTQASGLLFGSAGSAAFLTRKSRENDFDMFLDKSIKSETKITVRAKTIDENTKSINSPSKAQATDGKEKVKGIMQDKKAIKSNVNKTDDQTVDNISDDNQDPVDFIDSDLLGQILAMLSQIRNVIMEELNLTPEELDTMMNDLRLELSDLTDPKAINLLVLANNGSTDPFAMLVDEQLGDIFQSLLSKVEDIKSEANLMVTDDEMKLILEQSVGNEDDSQALIGVDEAETLQSQVVSKQDDDESAAARDYTNRSQAASEESDIDEKISEIASKDDSELRDTNDRKAKADKTDGFETFLDKLSANYDKPLVEFSNNNIRLYEIREIAQQIIDQIRVIINPEQTTMELQLNPEHLGKVNLTISSKEGAMTAHFAVQNDLAKQAIEGQLITLKETLAQQGIKVETIEVTVASYTFDQKSQSDDADQRMNKKQRSGHKITFDEAVAMSEESVEADNINLTDTMGYTIDYTA